MSKLEIIGALVAFIMALGLVGNADMEDQIAEEQFYIDMVCDGKWPDYNNLKPECD